MIFGELPVPHLRIEYSANLDALVNFAELCEKVRIAAVETGLFPIGGIRVRTVRCEHFAIADGRAGLCFLDVVMRIGEGRSLEARRAAGEHIFNALSNVLDPIFVGHSLALSLDIQINNSDLSWKRNNIHDRLKQDVKTS